MTTFATPRRDEVAVDAAAIVAVSRASRRDGIGALGLLLGMLGILLGLALTVGASGRIGQ